MGKRDKTKGNNFVSKPKSPRDFYATIDPKAVVPLLPHIRGLKYAEVCCGEGDLIRLIGDQAQCVWKSDIHRGEGVDYQRDASTIDLNTFLGVDCIVTNPPFSKDLLLPIIDHLAQSGKPLWLLLPADVMHNKYMAPYMKRCERVLSIGRLSWFPDPDTGKLVSGTDNYAWFKFSCKKTETLFIGRGNT